MRESLIAALDLLHSWGAREVHVAPGAYIEYARWYAGIVMRNAHNAGCFDDKSQGYAHAIRIMHTSDRDIVDRKLADGCLYNGMTIRLAE